MKRKENPGRKTSRTGKPEKSTSTRGRSTRKEDADFEAPKSKNTRGGARPEGSGDRPRKPYAGADRGAKNPFDKEKRSPGAYNRQDRTKKGAAGNDRAPHKPFDKGDLSFRKGPREDKPWRASDNNERAPRKPFDNDERAPRSFDRDDRPKKSFGGDERAPRKPFDKSDLSFRKSSRDDKPWRSSDSDERTSRKKFNLDDNKPGAFDREERPKKRAGDDSDLHAPFDKGDLSFRKGPREDKPWRASDNNERAPRKSFDKEERPSRSYDKDDRPKKTDRASHAPFDKGDLGIRKGARDEKPWRGSDKDERAPRKPYDKTDSSPRRESRDDRPRKTSTRGEAPKRPYDRKKPSTGRPFEMFERPVKPNRSEERAKKAYDEDERPKERTGRNANAPKFAGKSQGFFGIEKANVPIEAIRLNRYISMAGICSRREADDMIEAGVVSVNGHVVTNLGTKVNPGDDVRYNGERIRNEKLVYVLLNKPKDYITTMDDPNQRHTVMELVANACSERIYPVGRLDRNTTGLLLLTNDGDLAKTLTHPSSNVRKIYMAELNKGFKVTDMKKLVEGIELDDDGMVKVDDIAYDGDGSDKKVVGLEIHSGQNRVVRRLFEKLGYDVLKLDRVMFAGLTKKDLTRGRWRFLTEVEVGMLKMISGKKMKAAK